MERRQRQIVLKWMFAAVLLSLPPACAWANQTTPAITPGTHEVPDAQWAALFDTHVPLADRQRMLAALESDAAADHADDLYLLGSLYHMGQHAPGSPVQADPAKAAIYLENAAVRGNVLAMAKMAELKFTAGDFREAMNWAQIYAHYAATAGTQGPAAQSYAGELVRRIQDNISPSPSSMDAIMKDVDSFIAANDATIRAGIARPKANANLKPGTHKTHYATPAGERNPGAGIADFLVGFRADGTAASVQLVDSAPYTDVVEPMRAYVESMSVAPVRDGDTTTLRYAWIPVVMGDRRYHNWNRP
jgi:hypothetical protein